MLSIVTANGKPCLQADTTGVTEEDAAFLYGLTLLVRPQCIAEVGTGNRRSLRAFMEARVWLWMHLKWRCEVWTCDIRPDRVAAAMREFPDANAVCGDSTALAAAIVGPADLVFIDGLHTRDAVQADVRALEDVAKGGVCVFHDTTFARQVEMEASRMGAVLLPGPRGMGVWRFKE
jgi:predicted O-methyltransferase YrrM